MADLTGWVSEVADELAEIADCLGDAVDRTDDPALLAACATVGESLADLCRFLRDALSERDAA